MAPLLSWLIRTPSGEARRQQPDYELVIYLSHLCDPEKVTNFSVHCSALIHCLLHPLGCV